MIKMKPGYSLRNVLDVYVVMGSGKDTYIPNCIMSLNETGAFLWGILENGAEEASLADRLTEAYEVDSETAQSDVRLFMEQLRAKGLVEEC